ASDGTIEHGYCVFDLVTVRVPYAAGRSANDTCDAFRANEKARLLVRLADDCRRRTLARLDGAGREAPRTVVLLLDENTPLFVAGNGRDGGIHMPTAFDKTSETLYDTES